MSALFSVPNNDSIPWPVDFHRLMTAVNALGLSADIVQPGRSASIVTQGTPFRLSLDAAGRFISIRAMWNAALHSGADYSWVFAAANSWNRKKYFPTVYWLPSPAASSPLPSAPSTSPTTHGPVRSTSAPHAPDHAPAPDAPADHANAPTPTTSRTSLHICADFVVDIVAGLSPVQLQDNLEVGISSGIEAIHYMQRVAEETLNTRGIQ